MPEKNRKQYALRFLMWTYIVSMVMIFAGLTSAYLVRKGEGNWLEFSLPRIFTWTTALLVLSSGTIHWAYRSAQHDRWGQLNIALWLTTFLGVAFLTGQILGWQELVAMDVYLVGNPSGSFLYILTGMHAVHIVGALIAVFAMSIRAIQYKISSQAMVGLQLTVIFWHALDFLWLYLFVFLQVTH